MSRRADCLICGKRVWSISRNTGLWANAATLVLRQLGRPETVWDIRSVPDEMGHTWYVHLACANEHRAVLNEAHRQLPRRPGYEYELRPPGRAKVKIAVGMSQREVVGLLGEPIAQISMDVYLHFRLPVPAFRQRTNIDFWLFDVLAVPGRLLRVAFGDTRTVFGIDEVDRDSQPMPVREQPRTGPVDIVAGMSQQEVVGLLGEPIARTSTDDFLRAQQSVTTLGGPSSAVEFWFFDVLPTPGRALRIAFGDGKVLGTEEVESPAAR